MSDSVRPHRWQPTGLLCPQDSPGKNIGVGCHFLSQCMKVKTESEVIQSCPTISDPMDCSLPGSSIHGIFQARVLEWGAICMSLGKHKLKQHEIFFRIKPPPKRISNIQNTDNSKCWGGSGAIGALSPFWWDCQRVQSLWKTSSQFLTG